MTTALITGASSGIGLELAKICAHHKHDLILVARSEDKLNALKTELANRVNVTVITADLSDPAAPQALYDTVEAAKLNVDYLINNAGFGDFGQFKDSDWAKEQQMIQLNIMALTELTKLFMPHLLDNKGKVMNVASTAAFQPGPYMAVYYATKAYVLSFSEAIAHELKPCGVSVTALCPGPTESGFQDAADMHHSKLVKGKHMPSSAVVAEYGYQAMMSGKRVAVQGMVNKVMAQSVRFTPRRVITSVVAAISGPS